MPSITLRLFCLLLLLLPLAATTAQTAPTVPAAPVPAVLVADFSNTLQANERGALELKLGKFEDAGNAQIVVVLVPTLDGASVEEYAATLFNVWGIGDKTRNDGVLLLLAMQDRKMRIETGYGAEERITDAVAARIIRDQLTPRLREELPYLALHEATNALIKKLNPAYVIPADSLANAIEAAQLAAIQAKEAEEAANRAAAQAEQDADFRLGVLVIAVPVGILVVLLIFNYFRLKRQADEKKIREIFDLAADLNAQKKSIRLSPAYRDSADVREFIDGFSAELDEYHQAAENKKKAPVERLRKLCSERWQQVGAYTTLSRVYSTIVNQETYPKANYFAAEIERFQQLYCPATLHFAPMSLVTQRESQTRLAEIEALRPPLRPSAEMRQFMVLVAPRHTALAQNIEQCIIKPLLVLEEDADFLLALVRTPQNELLTTPTYAPLQSWLMFLRNVLGWLQQLFQSLERFNSKDNPQTFIKVEQLRQLQAEACTAADSLLASVYMQSVRTLRDVLHQSRSAEQALPQLAQAAKPFFSPSANYLLQAMAQYGDAAYLQKAFPTAIGTEKLSRALIADANALHLSFAESKQAATDFSALADTVYGAVVGSVYTSKYLTFVSSYSSSSSSSSSTSRSRSSSYSSSSSSRSSYSSSSSSRSSSSSSRSYGGGSSGGGGASGSW